MSRLAEETAQRERGDAAVEQAFQSLVRDLDSVTNRLEAIGESQMGLLHQRFAARFHNATAKLRKMTQELKQDAYWPNEASN